MYKCICRFSLVALSMYACGLRKIYPLCECCWTPKIQICMLKQVIEISQTNVLIVVALYGCICGVSHANLAANRFPDQSWEKSSMADKHANVWCSILEYLYHHACVGMCVCLCMQFWLYIFMFNWYMGGSRCYYIIQNETGDIGSGLHNSTHTILFSMCIKINYFSRMCLCVYF